MTTLRDAIAAARGTLERSSAFAPHVLQDGSLMPKGHYERRPRTPADPMMSPEMVREMNERREWVDVEPEARSTPDTLAAQTAAANQATAQAVDQQSTPEPGERDAALKTVGEVVLQGLTPEQMAVIESETAKPGVVGLVPSHKTFESWMAEDDTPLPAETRVTQLVREWAGRVTCGEHEVTWLPACDRSEIEVTLITPHGASILRKDAGNWRETDIAHALGQMTIEIGL